MSPVEEDTRWMTQTDIDALTSTEFTDRRRTLFG